MARLLAAIRGNKFAQLYQVIMEQLSDITVVFYRFDTVHTTTATDSYMVENLILLTICRLTNSWSSCQIMICWALMPVTCCLIGIQLGGRFCVTAHLMDFNQKSIKVDCK